MKWAKHVCPVVGTMLAVIVPAAGQTVDEVELAGATFTPADLTIDEGDTVRWIWVSGFHNVESGTVTSGIPSHDGNFRSGDPTGVGGTTYELVFDGDFLAGHPMPANTYPYYCVVHAGLNMIGSITIIVLGDVTRDGNVDLADHAAMRACLAGPDGAEPGSCEAGHFTGSDLDGDDDVDLRDHAAFQRRFSG